MLLSQLPEILDDPEIERHLQTGLTTHFRFELALNRKASLARTTIQIRYELWEEQFQVTTFRTPDSTTRRTLADPADLRGWWSDLEVPLCAAALAHDPPPALRVRLQVVPFSAAEQRETQRWFAESVRSSRTAESESKDRLERSESSLDRVFDGLLSTSIRRRPMVHLEWTLRLEKAPRP